MVISSFQMEIILISSSKSQYERIFKKWGFRKYLTEKEWAAIGYKLEKRNRENKGSQVSWRGVQIPPQKVQRETKRHTKRFAKRFAPLASSISQGISCLLSVSMKRLWLT
jgi:hypothetical protein